MPDVPRRTCPACSRRYAGLVAPDCPVCRGLGVLALGAAALHHYPVAAVARAVDLYLEHAAQHATQRLPLASRREALEAATDELRHAGVLHTTADLGTPAHTPAPVDAQAARVTELDAHTATRALGRPVNTPVLAALAARPLTDLTQGARPRDGRPPTVSATGSRVALAIIADPIDPLGPDTSDLMAARRGADHTAAVIATATPHAATRRRRTAG